MKQIIQKLSVFMVALLVVGSVAYFGTHHDQISHAASLGGLSFSSPSSTLVPGAIASVTVYEDSGTDPVNAVQASIKYDPTQLQYVSLSEGNIFPRAVATSTGTLGVIRVARSTTVANPPTGKNAIVTLTFKVIGSTGTTELTFDPAASFIVRSTDSTDILIATTNASL
jgi:hypothetical protein